MIYTNKYNMKYLVYLIFLFSQLSCFGQTISKFLVNDYRLNDTTISEIIEMKTYYENSNISTYKSIYYYNDKGFITQMVGLDTEGKLSTRMSYEYDNNDLLIQIKDEKRNHSLGYSSTLTKFIFDSLNLKEIETIGNKGELTSKSIVKTECGYPVSIYLYDENNSLIGYETAKYDYEKNEVLIKFCNSRGNMVGKPIKLKVNLRNDCNFSIDNCFINEFGDITQELKPKCLSCDELMTFKYEYKYDNNKNWVRRFSYRVNGKNTEKFLKEKRKIKYRNT